MTDKEFGIQHQLPELQSSNPEQTGIGRLPADVAMDSRIRETGKRRSVVQTHTTSAVDALLGMGGPPPPPPPESDSSPESTNWVIPGRGRGFLQQARDVVGSTVTTENLPDDLSGIFDD